MWQDVRFEAGELTVKALDTQGNILKTETLRTAGAPARLALSADRSFYSADGDDLCYITAKVLDKNGNFCPLANHTLYFSASGCGEFIASDNGDPTDFEVFHSSARDAFRGMAVGIFRTLKGRREYMCITVSGDGLPDAQISVEVR